MTALDLSNNEQWDPILEEFARETRMTACLSDETGSHPRCCSERYPLCAAIRENQTATTFICSFANTAMMAVVKKTGRPEIDICEAGLIRIVVPIIRNGRFAGQVFACGLASEEEELNSFLVARHLNIREEEVVELAKSTPFGSIERLKLLADRLFHVLNP
jgi:ligand-binding sensor protein